MRSGFSLVELSIVLVILGLLTGGILTGQNLIRAAELRSVITEFQQYQTAMHTFRDKYFGLPGDLRNATDFWGSAGGSGTIGDGCEAATGTGTQTCNGNGNGTIIYSPGVASEYNETFTFWQHLANAGLIEGSYTGIAGSGGHGDSIIGENVPISRVGQAGWSTVSRIGAVADHFDRYYGGSLLIGGRVASNVPHLPIFTPEEAWGVDKKIDDGKPAIGFVTPLAWDDGCTNATSATDTEAVYELSTTASECMIHFSGLY